MCSAMVVCGQIFCFKILDPHCLELVHLYVIVQCILNSYLNIADMRLQILAVLDLGRDAWISREDWIQNGIHVGSNRKYKDSYYLQAQAMCYMNS